MLELNYRKIQSHLNDIFNMFIGSGSLAIVQFLLSYILIRNIGTSGYATYTLITSTGFTLSTFSIYGLNYSAPRFLGRFHGNPNKITKKLVKYFVKITFRNLTLLTAIFLAIRPIISKLDNTLVQWNHFLLIVILMICQTIFEIISAIHSGLFNFQKLRNINLIRSISILCVIVMSLFIKNTQFLLTIFIILYLPSLLYGIRKLTTDLENSNSRVFELPTKLTKIIEHYSFVMFLAGILSLPLYQIAFLFLKYKTSIEIFALIGVTMTWQGILTFAPITYNKIVLPTLSSLRGTLSLQNATVFNGVFVIVLFGAILTVTERILIFYDPIFVKYKSLFILYLAGTSIGLVGTTFGSLLQSNGNYRKLVYCNAISGITTLIFTILLFKKYNITSLGIGIVLANINSLIMTIYFTNQIPRKNIKPSLFILLVYVLIIFILTFLSL